MRCAKLLPHTKLAPVPKALLALWSSPPHETTGQYIPVGHYGQWGPGFIRAYMAAHGDRGKRRQDQEALSMMLLMDPASDDPGYAYFGCSSLYLAGGSSRGASSGSGGTGSAGGGGSAGNALGLGLGLGSGAGVGSASSAANPGSGGPGAGVGGHGASGGGVGAASGAAAAPTVSAPVSVSVAGSDLSAVAINSKLISEYRTFKASPRKTIVRRSRVQGFGLFATEVIPQHEIIEEYAGSLIRPILTDDKEKEYDAQGKGTYMFRIDDAVVVDATIEGNVARFVNHSCDPNCNSKIVAIPGLDKKIVIYAKREIRPGEELTYDYCFAVEKDTQKIRCTCGAKNCRGSLN